MFSLFTKLFGGGKKAFLPLIIVLLLMISVRIGWGPEAIKGAPFLILWIVLVGVTAWMVLRSVRVEKKS